MLAHLIHDQTTPDGGTNTHLRSFIEYRWNSGSVFTYFQGHFHTCENALSAPCAITITCSDHEINMLFLKPACGLIRANTYVYDFDEKTHDDHWLRVSEGRFSAKIMADMNGYEWDFTDNSWIGAQNTRTERANDARAWVCMGSYDHITITVSYEHYILWWLDLTLTTAHDQTWTKREVHDPYRLARHPTCNCV